MQTIVNLGTGGADLNGQNGSTTSADSNDALFLDWPGDNAGNYVYLPGSSSNYMQVPDEAALDITGDIDIRVRVAMDDWSIASNPPWISKWQTSGQYSYEFSLRTGGNWRLYWSEDGTTASYAQTTTAFSTIATDGEAYWIRACLDVDNGASGYDVTFWYAEDQSGAPGSWTQLGSTVTGGATTNVHAGTSDVRLGGNNVYGMSGKYYRAQVLDGIDGTPVLDVDCSQITSGADTSFTALTGQTVTINRSTSGRKTVAVVSPVWLFGTDDYLEVADNALLDFGASDSFTVLAVVRQWASQSTYRRIFTKANSLDSGYYVINGSPAETALVGVDSGTPNVGKSIAWTYGTVGVIAMTVDRDSNELFAHLNGAVSTAGDVSSVGDLSNALPLRIGRDASGAAYWDGEVIAAAVFRRALTTDEIAALTTYYENRWA